MIIVGILRLRLNLSLEIFNDRSCKWNLGAWRHRILYTHGSRRWAAGICWCRDKDLRTVLHSLSHCTVIYRHTCVVHTYPSLNVLGGRGNCLPLNFNRSEKNSSWKMFFRKYKIWGWKSPVLGNLGTQRATWAPMISSVGNLQLSLGNLPLPVPPHPHIITHDAADSKPGFLWPRECQMANGKG